ncbi:ABC transporter ATP-binding protein [Desulfoluna limicola]|uniref:Nickel import system ATP-binding protein NikD n=1 Tax=Desulfoluna limicola TaxID=2810562 RepID=A0ABM7PIM6_9BACT|nr:ABC transporter ATP-binding protein [Desulfoluna limicola]BCS97014.1 ABC transporter ATP-binding protein [Desulfoluna limicola]
MLEIHDLSVAFSMYGSGRGKQWTEVISAMEVSVNRGEVVAVIGSSGAGKSLLAHAVLGILPPNAEVGGTFAFDGEVLTEARKRALRGNTMALVPQSVGYLNPLVRVKAQVVRAAGLSGMTRRAARQSQADIFHRYGLGASVEGKYPHQISGGMAKRVLTATATVGEADLLIADEPTSGLDPESVQKELHHLRELADAGKGILLITHDIAAALSISDRVSICYAGVTLETVGADAFGRPGALVHPYTRGLWNALPQNGFQPFQGLSFPKKSGGGCPFAFSCSRATHPCLTLMPPLLETDEGEVRCHHA